MIAFYIMGPSMKTLINVLFMDSTDSIVEKTVVMTRTATETEEKAGLKCVFIFSNHSSFEVLVCK
jgi:GTP-dependent phosphoenolpyruvate carboxykinase